VRGISAAAALAAGLITGSEVHSVSQKISVATYGLRAVSGLKCGYAAAKAANDGPVLKAVSARGILPLGI
jgi:hypothetical protein